MEKKKIHISKSDFIREYGNEENFTQTINTIVEDYFPKSTKELGNLMVSRDIEQIKRFITYIKVESKKLGDEDFYNACSTFEYLCTYQKWDEVEKIYSVFTEYLNDFYLECEKYYNCQKTESTLNVILDIKCDFEGNLNDEQQCNAIIYFVDEDYKELKELLTKLKEERSFKKMDLIKSKLKDLSNYFPKFKILPFLSRLESSIVDNSSWDIITKHTNELLDYLLILYDACVKNYLKMKERNLPEDLDKEETQAENYLPPKETPSTNSISRALFYNYLRHFRK